MYNKSIKYWRLIHNFLRAGLWGEGFELFHERVFILWATTQIHNLYWKWFEHGWPSDHDRNLYQRPNQVYFKICKRKLFGENKWVKLNWIWRKELRKQKGNQMVKFMFDYYIELLVSLSASLLLMNIFYIVFTFLDWHSYLTSCMTIGVILHYTLLNSFCWMLCFSLLQYLTYNRVLTLIDRFYLKSAIFSMGNYYI